MGSLRSLRKRGPKEIRVKGHLSQESIETLKKCNDLREESITKQVATAYEERNFWEEWRDQVMRRPLKKEKWERTLETAKELRKLADDMGDLECRWDLTMTGKPLKK